MCAKHVMEHVLPGAIESALAEAARSVIAARPYSPRIARVVAVDVQCGRIRIEQLVFVELVPGLPPHRAWKIREFADRCGASVHRHRFGDGFATSGQSSRGGDDVRTRFTGLIVVP